MNWKLENYYSNYKEKIFPKQEMQIKDDVKNQIKKINNPKAEREKDDSIQGKW